MRKVSKVLFGLAMLLLTGKFAIAAEPAAMSKVKVEFHWVEEARVDGVTEEAGFQSSCDPDSLVYQQCKPVLTLTPKHVAEVRLTHHDFSRSGLSSENYTVTFDLTEEAREILAAECREGQMRLLTISVDGKRWGIHRYEKAKGQAKDAVPVAARAESFRPDIGFMSSRADAQRIVDAFRKETDEVPAK
jgi:hypothetical protein